MSIPCHVNITKVVCAFSEVQNTILKGTVCRNPDGLGSRSKRPIIRRQSLSKSPPDELYSSPHGKLDVQLKLFSLKIDQSKLSPFK